MSSTALIPGWYVEFQSALLRQAPRPGEIDQVTAEAWTNNQKSLKNTLVSGLLPPPDVEESFMSGKPLAFKNWPAICAALREEGEGYVDNSVVWANALADPQTKHGQRLALAFPEFWSPTEVQGPVPWSLMKEGAAPVNQEQVDNYVLDEKDREDYNRLYAMSLGGMVGTNSKYPIPTFEFVAPGSEVATRRSHREAVILIPDNIDPDTARVGDRVAWRDKEWIIVEVNTDAYGNLDIAPAECIAMDL